MVVESDLGLIGLKSIGLFILMLEELIKSKYPFYSIYGEL